MRSKLLGLPTSIAFEIVEIEARGENFPVFKYVGKTSLLFVAAIKACTGSPIDLAISPAVRFPKFPLGTEKTRGSSLCSKWAYARK